MAKRTLAWKASKRAAVLAALAHGNTRNAACEAVGLGRSTFYEWIGADEEFSTHVLRAEAQAEIHATECIRQAALTNWRAAAWWLERRHPEDWGKPTAARVLKQMAREVGQMSDAELLRSLGYDAARPEVVYVNDWRADESVFARSEALGLLRRGLRLR